MPSRIGALLFFLAVLLRWFVEGDLSCQKQNPGDPCRWSISGEEAATGIVDLNPIFNQGPLEVKTNEGDFHYNACMGVQCEGATCGQQNCVGCQKSDQNYGLGDISTVLCDASQSDPSKKQWIIVLSYTGGTNDRKSQFTFHYTPSDTTPSMTFGKEDPELDYHLAVQGNFEVPGAPTPKPTPPPSGGGGGGGGVDPGIPGLVVIAVLIIAAVSYLVVGIIIQAGVKGARGVEIIPNLSFWKDFPFLLKDGFLFTFTCPCLRNKGSYSQL